jgi:hypothetical protein
MKLSSEGVLMLWVWIAFIAGFLTGCFWCGRPTDDDFSEGEGHDTRRG